MIGRPIPSTSLRSRAVGLVAALLLVGPAAHAGPVADRKAPTTPANLTITGTTAYSVSFAWGASSDNSGSFTYRLVNRSWGTSVVVPGTQTTFTWEASNLNPRQSYSFQIYAVDAANNWSKPSNTVSATLPPDTTTPKAPQVTLTDNGPTHLSLAWTTEDDDPSPTYLVFKNGVVFSSASSNESITVALLAPETTHTFTVQARDGGGHLSPMSAPLTATTEASDPSDHTPPTIPALLWGGVISTCEVMLRWDASSDDVTPAEFIRYDISVNGQWIDSTTLGYIQVIEYGIVDGPNRFEIVAVDEAGNASAPAEATFDLEGCITP
jgi:chitodextrinase